MEDIARFVEGDMEGEERNQFEASLRTNQDLQAGLDRYHDIHSSLKMKLTEDENEVKLKQTLSEVSKNHFLYEARVIPMRRYLVWCSAVAAVFVLFLIWAPWRKSLYRQYADTEMIAMTERGDTNGDQMQKAVEAFNQREFSEARVALEEVNNSKPGNSMVQYYYAITLIETGETQKARVILENLYKGTSVFKYNAAFYIALSYLKEKDEKNARLWLKEIPTEAAGYTKSQELLNKLK